MSDSKPVDWGNLPPEEKERLRKLAMKAFDMETESFMADKMGPYGGSAVDMSRWTHFQTDKNWSLKGSYLPEDYTDKDVNAWVRFASKPLNDALGRSVQQRDKLAEIGGADRVVTFDNEWPEDTTVQHEFVHRFEESRDDKPYGNEGAAYLMPLFRASNKEDFLEAARGYFGHYGHPDAPFKSDDELFEAAEEAINGFGRPQRLAKLEAQIQEERGQPGKTRKWLGFLEYEDRYKDSIENYRYRQKMRRGN